MDSLRRVMRVWDVVEHGSRRRTVAVGPGIPSQAVAFRPRCRRSSVVIGSIQWRQEEGEEEEEEEEEG